MATILAQFAFFALALATLYAFSVVLRADARGETREGEWK